MGNFISQYAKDNRVESIIHITNMIVRAGMQIKSDKKSDTDYFVMSGNTVEDIINAYQNKNAKSALVIDDLGLQVINRLKQEGVTDITLCLTRIPEKMFALTKARIKKTFKDFNINIISLEELTYMKVDLVIANPPYGKIGADIVKTIRTKVAFKEWVNLEPGNDYFTNDNYKYIDPLFKPIIRRGAFTDVNRAIAPAICKLTTTENKLTTTGARLLISIQNENELLYKALSELWLHVELVGSLTFTRKSLEYSDEYFIFNSGGFDISNRYLAVSERLNWTNSTNYNIFKIAANTVSGSPAAKIKGCLQFKKLIYSELGLKMIKLWFSSSPEGWGFGGKLGAGMFADIDYSDCLTWNDVFTKLNVSEDNQKVLIEAAEKFELNDKEKEICKIAKEIL